MEEVVDVCHNDACPDPQGLHGGVTFLQCSSCKTALYCSKYCQVEHWRSCHSQECCNLQSINAALKAIHVQYPPLASVKGMIAISDVKSKQTREQVEILDRMAKGDQTLPPFKLRAPWDTKTGMNGLNQVIAYLSTTPPPLEEFFTGVKASLLNIQNVAEKAELSTALRLDAAMRAWAARKDYPASNTTMLLTRWKIETKESDTPENQGIAYLIEKKSALSNVVMSCEYLLTSNENIKLGHERRPTSLIEDYRRAWIASLVDTLIDLRDNVVGLDSVKGQIGSFVQKTLLYQSRSGFLNFGIFGNPGTGKTEIASRLAEILYRLGLAPVRSTETTVADVKGQTRAADFARLTKADFVASFAGQTAHLTRIAMLRGLGTLMFIDEAYQLVTSPSDEYGKEALAQIVSDLDEYQGIVSIVLAGYETQIREALFKTNPGLMRRISDIWILAPYTADELYVLLVRYFVRNEGYEAPADIETKSYGAIKEAVSALHMNGVFLDSNAGIVTKIVELYKTIYAKRYFDTSNNGINVKEQKQLQQKKMVLQFDIVVEALVQYGKQMGYTIYSAPGTLQETMPRTAPPEASTTNAKGKEEDDDDDSMENMRKVTNTPKAFAKRK